MSSKGHSAPAGCGLGICRLHKESFCLRGTHVSDCVRKQALLVVTAPVTSEAQNYKEHQVLMQHFQTECSEYQ